MVEKLVLNRVGKKVLVGKRMLKRLDSEVDLAVNGSWRVVLVGEWCCDGWASLKVFDHRKSARKSVFVLGYNGQRFSKSRDAGILVKRHPDVLPWVETVLKEKGLNYGDFKKTKRKANGKQGGRSIACEVAGDARSLSGGQGGD